MVNYKLEGPPAPARLVVFLHGLQSSLIAFEKLLPYFWEQGFRTLVYDHYGHGLSSSPCCSPLNHITLATQLEELIAAVAPDAEKIDLIGFSMGGLIASEFARNQPQRASHLCLMAPAGLMDRDTTPCSCFLFKCLRGPAGCCVVNVIVCFIKLLIYCFCWSCCIKPKLMKSRSAREAVSPDVGRPERFGEVSEGNLRRFAARPARSGATHFRILRRMPMWGDEYGIYEDLVAAKVPVLFLWGTHDGTIPLQEVAPELLRIFDASSTSCIEFPNTGHHLFLEYPKEVACDAINWFRGEQHPAWQQRLANFRLTRLESTAMSVELAETSKTDTIGQPSAV